MYNMSNMNNVNNGGPPGDQQGAKAQSIMGTNASSTQRKLAPINTHLASAANDSNQTSKSSYTGSNANSYSTTSYTPATSLYAPSMWSPKPANGATQSATMPPKLTWENYNHQGSNIQAQEQSDAAGVPSPVHAQQGNVPNSAVGLGLYFGEVPMNRDIRNAIALSPAKGTDLPGGTNNANENTRYSLKQEDLTIPYINPFVRNAANPNASTFPLAQHPFRTQRDVADQPRALRDSNFVEDEHHCGTRDQDAGFNGTDQSSTIDVHSPPMSSLTEHPVALHPERANETLILEEEMNRFTWPHQAELSRIGMIEGVPNARQIVKGTNSGQLPVPSAFRLICLRTEYVENIWRLFETSQPQWVLLEKVAPRLMRTWEGRQNENEKIFLLISVNRHKSYCALAEMRGPWTPGGDITGWADENCGAHKLGTLPITWVCVKNVPYTRFDDIKHEHNQQPITNMWTGMHFPGQTAFKVLQRFTEAPHYTNMLCWFSFLPYSPHNPGQDTTVMRVPPASSLFPELYPTHQRGGHNGQVVPYNRGRGNGYRGPLNQPPRRYIDQGPMSANWRQPQYIGQPGGLVSENNMTPTAGNHHGFIGGGTAGRPPNLDGPASPLPLPGDMVQCIMSSSGTLIPVAPATQCPASTPVCGNGNSNTMPEQSSFPTQGSQPISLHPAFSDNWRGRGNARGGLRGGRRGTRGGRGISSYNAPRGNNSPFNVSRDAHSQQGTGEAPTSTVHRMRSKVDMAKSPVAPGILRHTKTTANLSHQYKDADVPDNDIRLQRAAPFANFVAHSSITPTDTASSFTSTVANTNSAFSHVTDPSSPSSYKYYGNEIALQHPHGPMLPVQGSSSHKKSFGTMKIADNKSPGVYKLYPIPLDWNDTNEQCTDDIDLSIKVVRKATQILQTNETMDDETKAKTLDDFDKKIDNLKIGVAYAKTTLKYVPPPRSESGEVAADPRHVQAINEKHNWDKPYTRKKGSISPVVDSENEVVESFSKNGDVEDMRRRDQCNRHERFLVTGSWSSEVKANVSGLVDTPPHSTTNSRVEAFVMGSHSKSSSGVFSDCTGVGGGVPLP